MRNRLVAQDRTQLGADEMGNSIESLLRWMLEVAEARNTDNKARTVNLKFSRNTLVMWQERVRVAMMMVEGGMEVAR